MLYDRGAMYFAFGAWHFNEACRSARSFKYHNPAIPLFLVTQRELKCDALDIFDHVLLMERKPDFRIFTDRVRFLNLSPFLQTLFIDSDTIVIGDISAIFDYLTDNDFAIAEHPDSPLVNCGVFAYRRTAKGPMLIGHWRQLLERLPQATADDQIVFNQEIIGGGYLERNDIRMVRIPWQRYNVKDNAIWALQNLDAARILHTHDWRRVLNELPFPKAFVEFILQIDSGGDNLARRAQLARQEGNIARALHLAHQAVQFNAGNGHYKVVLADLLLEQGDKAGAREILELAVSLDPKHLLFNVRLAEVYASQDEFEQARAIATQCIEWNADYEPAQRLIEKLHNSDNRRSSQA